MDILISGVVCLIQCVCVCVFVNLSTILSCGLFVKFFPLIIFVHTINEIVSQFNIVDVLSQHIINVAQNCIILVSFPCYQEPIMH
jgi:hypothetical protein